MRKYVIAACVLTACVLLVASVALAKAEVVRWESPGLVWVNDCTGESLVFDVKGPTRLVCSEGWTSQVSDNDARSGRE